jgi:hypothetical protein
MLEKRKGPCARLLAQWPRSGPNWGAATCYVASLATAQLARPHVRATQMQKSPYVFRKSISTVKHCFPRLTLCTKHPAKFYLRNRVVHAGPVHAGAALASTRPLRRAPRTRAGPTTGPTSIYG